MECQCVCWELVKNSNDIIAVNALWPRTAIATLAVEYVLGGDYMMKRSRKASIMSDSAYIILTC